MLLSFSKDHGHGEKSALQSAENADLFLMLALIELMASLKF